MRELFTYLGQPIKKPCFLLKPRSETDRNEKQATKISLTPRFSENSLHRWDLQHTGALECSTLFHLLSHISVSIP